MFMLNRFSGRQAWVSTVMHGAWVGYQRVFITANEVYHYKTKFELNRDYKIDTSVKRRYPKLGA